MEPPEKPNYRQLKLTDINKYGMVFTIIPLVGMKMSADQIKAELKVAHMKMDEAMQNWEDKIKEKREAT